MYKTKATYLIYYFLPFQEMFILDMKKYRNWFKENYSSSHGFYKKVIKNYEYDSVGYIFSREKLRGLPFCRVVKVVNEEDKENNHEGS